MATRQTFPTERSLRAAASITRETPLLPSHPVSVVEKLVALTVLTGLEAGRIIPLDDRPLVIGRDTTVDLVASQPGVSATHARITRVADGTFVLEDLGSTNGTFIGERRVHVTALAPGDRVQLGPTFAVRFDVIDGESQTLQRALYESSIRDPLTHAHNQRYLTGYLAKEVTHARRAALDLCVLTLDVDHFKRVNDTYGHLAGDRALGVMAMEINGAMRSSDILARAGGDEFVIVAKGSDMNRGRELAERVRRAVEGLTLSAKGAEVQVTVSVGVAALSEVGESDEPIRALCALSDERLYVAKMAGRNRVCAADQRD
jgi:diguanylate cyclase (GGDEF)-like protein